MDKIVHIMLCGPVTDGWNYQDNLLTKYQRKLGYQVTMITSQWIWGKDGKLCKSDRTNYINSDDVKVIRLPIEGKDDHARKFKRYKGLLKQIETEKPDILFVHGVSFLDSKEVVKYCKKNPNVELFVDNHMDFSNSGTNWLSRNVLHKIIWRYHAKKMEPYVRKFYGVLPARVDWLVSMYGLPKEKCELLVMGADDELIESASKPDSIREIREKYNIAENDFLIITGGKIDRWKTQTLLLMEAVHRIKSDKVKLIVFGSVEENLMEKVNQLADGKKVQYVGWIESKNSYQYFAAADLVVFPGRHSVFWEQVAGQGIPMLCKYWEGTTHVDIGGNVKFLQQDNVNEIEKSLLNLLENTNAYEKMREAAATHMTKFRYGEIARISVSDV